MSKPTGQPIVAVLGLPGSGKTEVVRQIEQLGWPKVYFGGVVRDEVKRRGLPETEANERAVREELRAKHGMAAMAKLTLPQIQALAARSGPVLVESLYSWEEYRLLKEEFGARFQTIAVYASPAVRYARLIHRPERPLRVEEAQERDYAQIENTHQGGPIAMADYTVINDGTLEELQEKVENVLKQIRNSNIETRNKS